MTLNWPLPADESPLDDVDATPVPTPAATATPAPETRTFATFVVNSEDRGEHVVVLKKGGVFAQIKDLRDAGVVVPQAALNDAVGGYIPLTELAPQITASFDLQGPSVRLDARSSDSLTQRSDFSVLPSQDWRNAARRERSGYLDYSAAIGSGGAWSTAEALTLSDSSKTFFVAGSLDRTGFRRSLGNLTWDDAARRHIIVVGDVIADSGQLGSSQIVEGVGIARSYGSTPYEPRLTSPTLTGTALTPSVADVYVNGQLIRSVNVPPGAFDFRNLPAGGGANNAQIVLRDAFGNASILSARYYGGNPILRAGDTDYSYSLGEARAIGGFGPANAGIVALGRYAVGLSRATTVSGHAEFGGGFENAGAGFAHAGRLGIVSFAVAQSRDRGLAGLAGSVGYTFGTANVWLNASFQAATPHYETLGQRYFPDATVSDAFVNLGVRPFRGNYTTTLAYNSTRSQLGTFARGLTWQNSLPVGRAVSLLVSTGVITSSRGSYPTLSVLLIRTGGRSARTTTTLSLQGDGGAVQPALNVEQSAPVAGGSGYDATLYPSGSQVSTGRYSLRSSIGNVDVDYGLARSGKVSGDVAVSGAVAFAGRYLHLAQPIADGFALVKVSGGEPVNVLINSQDYGVTDAKGLLVLPNLQSYFAQRVSVQRDEGPVNLDISNEAQNIVVASRRGTVLDFSAAVVTAVIGTVTVVDAGLAAIPAFGQLVLKVPKGDVTSDLDGNGRFYFEDVPPGTYGATVRYAGGECRFTLAVPHATTIEQNIGAFTCARS